MIPTLPGIEKRSTRCTRPPLNPLPFSLDVDTRGLCRNSILLGSSFIFLSHKSSRSCQSLSDSESSGKSWKLILYVKFGLILIRVLYEFRDFSQIRCLEWMYREMCTKNLSTRPIRRFIVAKIRVELNCVA